MITLKHYIKELKKIDQNLESSESSQAPTEIYAWLCVLEQKLHSLDHLIANEKATYIKAMIAEKKKKL